MILIANNDTSGWVGEHGEVAQVSKKESYNIFHAMSWNIFSIFTYHLDIIKWHAKIFFHVKKILCDVA